MKTAFINTFRPTLPLTILAITIASSVFATGERIDHIPVAAVFQDALIDVEARVIDGLRQPVEAWLYFRSGARDAFEYVELTVEQDRLTGVLDTEPVEGNSIEYYIQARLDDNRILTFPVDAPDAVVPLRIDLKPRINREVTARKSITPGIVILSPEPNSRIYQDEILIAISVLTTRIELQPGEIRLEIDGEDHTRDAIIDENILTHIAADLEDGSHFVRILQEGAENRVLAAWSFTKGEEVYKPPFELPVQGKVMTGYSHEDISERVRNIGYLDGRLYGEDGDVEWLTRGYITSLEAKDKQPQNRYTASLKYGGLVIRAGDAYPRFSEFTMWGVRSRGLELNLESRFLNLGVAWGYLRRNVGGSGYYDTSSVSLPVSTVLERRIVERGTYSRRALAIRPGIPITRNIVLSFNLLKVKDDRHSSEWSNDPKDNIVFGGDVQFRTPDRRIPLSSTIASTISLPVITSGWIIHSTSAGCSIGLHFISTIPTPTMQ